MEESASINSSKTTLSRYLEDLITDICKKDTCMLLDLAYELLKMESPDDPFVRDTLYGQVKPEFLVNLICSNHFNPVTE